MVKTGRKIKIFGKTMPLTIPAILAGLLGTAVLGAWISGMTGSMVTTVTSTEPVVFVDMLLDSNAFDTSNSEQCVSNNVTVENIDANPIDFNVSMDTVFADVSDNCVPDPTECNATVTPTTFSVDGQETQSVIVTHCCAIWSCPVTIESNITIAQV